RVSASSACHDPVVCLRLSLRRLVPYLRGQAFRLECASEPSIRFNVSFCGMMQRFRNCSTYVLLSQLLFPLQSACSYGSGSSRGRLFLEKARGNKSRDWFLAMRGDVKGS